MVDTISRGFSTSERGQRTDTLADRGYVLENGRQSLSGSAAELAASDEVRRAYLGL